VGSVDSVPLGATDRRRMTTIRDCHGCASTNSGYNPVAAVSTTDEIVARIRRGAVDAEGESADATGEIRKLTSLIEISQALSGSLKLADSLPVVLETLERHHSVVRASVTLVDEDTGELYLTGSSGETPRNRTRAGDGMIGRVIETGRAVVVPQVSQEPLLEERGRRGEARELSFICVPLSVNRRTVGALAVHLAFKRHRQYQRSLKFFRIVGSMIAQAVKVTRVAESERRRLVEENAHLRDELRDRYAFRHIIGNSAPIQAVYEHVAQVARTNTTVLVRGESGTGKEMIAHAIHYNSPRAKKPFVKVSCAALPGSLIESELFGYERGAFTGAHALKKGRVELAEGGTLFLDEIGDVDVTTQVKLLRVLQEREIERLGGTTSIRVNVRLIAATHRPLEELMSAGTFREDLFYRLNVFTIFAPPLRERKPDIMLLADHFLAKYSVEHGKHIKRIATPAIDMLTSYHWPGNVRELENTIERAVLVCEGSVIHGHHLPPTLQTAEASGTMLRTSLADNVAAFERDLIQDALKSTRGNRARAARLLQTTERILGYKVRKYGIDSARFIR
jgi:Nif-specific regulatory protein